MTRVDGTLLVVATYTTYVSSDGGTSFTPWDVGRTIRAVAERNGALFVAADNFVDGFAVGVTHDDGATWEPLIKYEDIQGPLECEPTGQRCQQTWAMLTDFLMRRMPTEPAPRDEPKGGGCACATPSGRAGWSLLLLLVAGWSRRSEHRR